MTPFSGVTVSAGGKEWVVPSLSAGEVVRLHRDGFHDRIAKAKGWGDLLPEELLVVGLALRRNYPELSDSEIEAFSPLEVAALYAAAWKATFGVAEETSPEAESPKES